MHSDPAPLFAPVQVSYALDALFSLSRCTVDTLLLPCRPCSQSGFHVEMGEDIPCGLELGPRITVRQRLR